MIEHDIWFSTIKLSDSIKIKLLKELGTTENVWHYSRDNSHMILKDDTEYRIKDKIKNSFIPKEIDFIKRIVYKNEIRIVNYNEPLFPSKLKYFDDSPSILFYKGTLKN
ncbi:MAG: hypothetical protein AB9844_11320 [Clostridiaceae bacterium]